TAPPELVYALAKALETLKSTWTSFYPGMREEGPQRQSIKKQEVYDMFDSHAPLNDLLAKVQGIELASICQKLKAIVACADLYIEAIAANAQDESLVHLAEVRREALILLEECGKLPV